MNKKQLSVLLSQVKVFEKPDISLEQYPTDSEIAADSLWYAYQQGDIENKVIADLGTGTGMFAIGALILGAKKIFMVDIDPSALKIAKENLKTFAKQIGKKPAVKIMQMNVKDFNEKVQVIIQNPPFGTRTTHHDKLFLIKAMELSKKIYSFHKLSTENFIQKITQEYGFEIKNLLKYKFPLKKSFWFHTTSVRMVDVGCWHIEKNSV